MSEPHTRPLVQVLARAIHTAHRTAPYPWWHTEESKCRVAPHVAQVALDAIEAAGFVIVPRPWLVSTAILLHTMAGAGVEFTHGELDVDALVKDVKRRYPKILAHLAE
jgi:hypothetical protein